MISWKFWKKDSPQAKQPPLPDNDPNDRLMKVVLVANFARVDFGGFIDHVLSKMGITRKDFPEKWHIGRNLATYENPGVEFWGTDEAIQRITKMASDTWGPWLLDQTRYQIGVHKFSNTILGNGVVGFFRSHAFLASRVAKGQG
jgi:hypothetical protein